ncbi:MAG: hypothetical protein J6S63_01490 [Atopobiaceae bacterium]|nr:hypothetical protein [Atopobiaceae bacterium]
MAQNITLLGASYSAVPSVTLPKSGGGTASFTDVTDTTAAAADVASGKYFYTAAGVRTAGTASGGALTPIATVSLGTISTTATSATDTGKSVTVSNAHGYDLLVVEISVDSAVNGRHLSTVETIFLSGSSTVSTKNGSSPYTTRLNFKASSNGTVSSRTGSYGIYPNSASISGSNVTMPIYMRYNSTTTGTINNAYTARVYGINLVDLIGG